MCDILIICKSFLKGGSTVKYNKKSECVEMGAAELCAASFYKINFAKSNADNAAIDEIERVTDGYIKHLSVSKKITFGAFDVKINGIVDGYFEKADGVRVDFVKSVPHRELTKKTDESYMAYVKCCAWLVCVRDGLQAIFSRVVLRSAESSEFKVLEKKFYFNELEVFVKTLLSEVKFLIEQSVKHETLIRPSAVDIPFPYEEIRDGQDEMMRCVASVIRKGRRMFAQAPTGIGKTISALYPAVRAFGKGECDKIFYFTAKTDTAREAYSAASKLFAAGAKLKTVVLSSKDSMCCSEMAKKDGCRDARYCNDRDCGLSKRYKDKAPAALAELLSMQNGFYSSVITEVALKHGVCPYELSLDLSELCDIIICDYNYLFDPYVRIKRYFENSENKDDYVFLVDEAHNLIDRARGIYSASVSLERIQDTHKLVGQILKELDSPFENAEQMFFRAKELCRENTHTYSDGDEVGYYISRNYPEFIGEAMRSFGERLEKWIKYNKQSEFYEVIDGVYSEIRKFVGILEFYDDKYMTYVEVQHQNVTVSFNCMDPSDILDGILSKGRASVMFSATLAPISYFCDLLGGGKQPLCLDLASPYDPENLCLAAIDSISTRYEDRDKNCKKIATCIAAAVAPKAGNYIVYFPSYGYLEKVHEAFVKKYPKVRTIVQKKGMSRRQHEEFINSFKDDENKMRIGFCVLGGSFSEGVDLPGNRLIGSIIVGVGLPGFSSERNIMRDYFENRYENGFEYAYTYPGMNNILQAAGRVIRTDEDKGIVVLIDDRYSDPKYKQLFPKHWSHLMYAGDAASLSEIIKRFWEKHR